ncbi:MAG: cytochrome c [Chromatiales bacterium]|jgi:mono/diheme cytochrome c family protein
MKFTHALLASTLLLTTGSAFAATTGDAENGQKLHEANCSRCHGTEVYLPPKRKIASLESLKQRSMGCNSMTGANLFPEEVDDIVHYLNTSFYKFEE